MTYLVSITSQGQISIPSKIRKELGFSKNKKALISVEQGKVILEPVRDILELRGSLKTTKIPLTSEQLHNLFASSIATDYAKKIKSSK